MTTTKVFPAGTDMSVIENYLAGGDHVPHFLVSKHRDEVNRFIREATYKKPDYFAPYWISHDVVEATNVFMPMKEVGALVDSWDRHTVFWMDIVLPDTNNMYLFICFTARDPDVRAFTPTTVTTPKGWVTRSRVLRMYRDTDKIDLMNPEKDKVDDVSRRLVVEYGMTVIANVIDGLINRATKYVAAKGHRSALDVARGKPTIVIISLSSPRYISDHNKTAVPTGIHMPLHDVSGHWRRLQSGRLVWVKAHQRGDPDQPRRTITRIVT